MQPGFFGKLFDTSFKNYVTPQIIKIIFWIAVGFIGLATIIWVVAAFAQSVGQGLLYLILSPLVALLWVIMVRVYLELVAVIFRIAGLLEGMARAQGVDTTAPAPPLESPAPAYDYNQTPPPPPAE